MFEAELGGRFRVKSRLRRLKLNPQGPKGAMLVAYRCEAQLESRMPRGAMRVDLSS